MYTTVRNVIQLSTTLYNHPQCYATVHNVIQTVHNIIQLSTTSYNCSQNHRTIHNVNNRPQHHRIVHSIIQQSTTLYNCPQRRRTIQNVIETSIMSCNHRRLMNLLKAHILCSILYYTYRITSMVVVAISYIALYYNRKLQHKTHQVSLTDMHFILTPPYKQRSVCTQHVLFFMTNHDWLLLLGK